MLPARRSRSPFGPTCFAHDCFPLACHRTTGLRDHSFISPSFPVPILTFLSLFLPPISTVFTPAFVPSRPPPRRLPYPFTYTAADPVLSPMVGGGVGGDLTTSNRIGKRRGGGLAVYGFVYGFDHRLFLALTAVTPTYSQVGRLGQTATSTAM